MKTYGQLGYDPERKVWGILAEPHVMLRLKRLFLKVDKGAHGVVQISDTPETCRDLEWFIDRYPMVMDNGTRTHLKASSLAFEENTELLSNILGGRFEPRSFKMAIPPRPYQAIAAELFLRSKTLLLSDSLGLGKTCSAIAGLADPAVRPALVVCMTHLPLQWKAEIERFTPEMRVHVIKSRAPYPMTERVVRGKTIKEPFPDVLITTYSKLDGGWADVLAHHVKTVVFDEIQDLRHAATDKYRAATHIAHAAEYRWGLSGTPIHNYGEEMFNVVQVLRPGALGERDEFLREWCHRAKVKVGASEQDKAIVTDPKAFGLYLRDSGVMLRRERSDVGRELPKFTRVPHYIDADMEALNKIEGKAVELAKIILAQGGLEKGAQMRAAEEFSLKLRMATGVAKAPYVAQFARMVVENDEPLLLGAWHRDVYAILLEQLADLKPVLYSGSETMKQKAAALEEFRSGRARILLMSLRSGAGVDGLQHMCRTTAHAELDWSPAVHDQFDGRIDRDGQKDSGFGYYLLSDVGSDPVVSSTLGVKQQQIDGIRNPKQSMVTTVQADPDRIKKLALAYLQRRGMPGTPAIRKKHPVMPLGFETPRHNRMTPVAPETPKATSAIEDLLRAVFG